MRILCLCLGNICRSPTAQGVLQARAAARGLAISVDSAGTGSWHVGEPPDRRAQRAAKRRGYDLSQQRARQLSARDFDDFDLILAMDAQNLADAQRLQPENSRATVVRFLDHAGLSDHHGGDVPDPYYTDTFDDVVALIERASDAVLDRLSDARR